MTGRGWIVFLKEVVDNLRDRRSVATALDSITSLDRLEQLTTRVLKAANWREALAPN